MSVADELSRRRFLQVSAAVASAGVTSPLWLRAGSLFGVEDAHADGNTRKLLVLLLAGGNDGLNTVVPYGLSEYYDNRRQGLAYGANEVLTISGSKTVGLHPNLSTIQHGYENGKVAIIQGVGYDQPDLSHFGSMDIWQTASPSHKYLAGWLGRWLDRSPADSSVVKAVAIGDYLPQALVGDTNSGWAVPFSGFTFWDGADANPASAAARLHSAFLKCADAHPTDRVASALLAADRNAVAAVKAISSIGNPEASHTNSLTDQMTMAMSLLSSNLGVDIAFVTLGSFDDHASERGPHAQLLKQVDGAVAQFQKMATATGKPQNFLLYTFSEFGRRVEENGSGGTDHGTAGPMFVVGDAVKGGLYGAQPLLAKSKLDADGNMIRQVELRDVYATLLDNWLVGATSTDVLGSVSGLHPVPFLK
jgi:uncharacterized protein (DUF1501 family)